MGIVAGRTPGKASQVIGTWSCDLETERLTWCDSVRSIFGMPLGATPDRATSLQCYAPASRLRLDSLRAMTIRTGRPFTMDASLLSISGEPRWMRIVAAVERDATARPRLYGVKQDITFERTGLETARRCPGNDPLTGLAGVAILDEALMALPRRSIGNAALVLISLPADPDAVGAADRDAILLECAARLRRRFQSGGLVARTHQDQFAILIERSPAPPALDMLLDSLSMALRRPVPVDGGWLRCDVAIGAAVDRSASRPDPIGLRARAEIALGEALIAVDGRPRIAGLPPMSGAGGEAVL